MAATQTGETLMVGAGTTVGNYVVKSITVGGADVSETLVTDEDGVLATRVTKFIHPKIEMTLVCKAAAAPLTDFPVGDFSTVQAFATYWVDDCSYTRTEDPAEVSVSLTAIGIS